MQRDTDFTFEEILEEASMFNVHTIQYALARVQVSDSSEVVGNLRYLRVPEPEENQKISAGSYMMTEKGDFEHNVDYIAVSYCWESFRKAELSQSVSTASLTVIDKGVEREPRCPQLVIERAARFAVARGVNLLWIDQECIDQTDPDDVQMHLMCMHAIFKQARFSIGLLTFELTAFTRLTTLMMLGGVFGLKGNKFDETNQPPPFLLDVKTIYSMTRLLNAIRRDRWFSRTWVYQERYSADNQMELLLRLSPEVQAQVHEFGAGNVIGHDLPFPLKGIGMIPAGWLMCLRRNSLETPELGVALRALHIAAQKICARIDGVDIEPAAKVFEGSMPHEHDRPSHGFAVKMMFDHIEGCDNLVVSDRVAILANVADLDMRISTRGLSSYSLSLLSLLHANDLLPQVLIRTVCSKTTFPSPYVNDVTRGDLLLNAQHLGGDFQAIALALAESLRGEEVKDHGNSPGEAEEDSKPGTEDEGESDEKEEESTSGEDPISKVFGPVKGIISAVPLPASATICDVFDGIIGETSSLRADVTHEHGDTIVRYAINNRQFPRDSVFVAFLGPFCWKSDFVLKHFSQ